MIVTAEIRAIWGEATRAGITRETIGQWLNTAARFQRQGNIPSEIKCLRFALEVHNTWGQREPTSYSMAEGTLQRVMERLAEIDPQPEQEVEQVEQVEQVEEVRPMTIKQIIAAIREMGLTCTWIAETKEFRINYKRENGGTEDTACYADREDVIGTARAFASYKAVPVVEQVGQVGTATTSEPVTVRVTMENNAGQLVLAGHVLCKSPYLFMAQPRVGRPHTWFNSLEQAERYTRGE